MKFITGLALGSIVGVAAALIQNNEESISESANRIKNNILDTKDNLVTLKNELSTTLPQVVQGISADVNDYMEEIKPQVAALQEDLEDLQENINN